MKMSFRWLVILVFAGISAWGGWRLFLQTSLPSKTTGLFPSVGEKTKSGAAVETTARAFVARESESAMSNQAPLRAVEPSLFEQIEAAANSSDESEWNRALNELFPALFRQDRKTATRMVENMAAGERRDRLLRVLARLWATVDFAGATNWIDGLANPEDRKIGLEDACFAVIDRRPEEAVRAWDALGYAGGGQTLGNLVQAWAAKDLPAAQAWAVAHPASMQRDEAVARVGYMMAESKPADAAALVVREIPPGPAQTEAVISVLHRWAEHDLNGATAWAAGFSDEALRDRAIGELAGITPTRH